VVPEGITQLPAYAFCGSDYLKTISLPSTLESIGNYAFQECTAITHFAIPENVTTIGKSAFSGCSKLLQIWIGEKVTTIQSNAFKNCAEMTIHGISGSYAETYATENSIPFSTEAVAFDQVMLSGKVTDASGKGIGDVNVTIYNQSKKEYIYTSVKTDEQGNWNIPDAIQGHIYVVSYYKAGYEMSANDIRCTAVSGGVVVETVTATKIPGLVCNEADYTYTVDTTKETATITGYTGSDTSIVLPSTLGGYPVTAIAEKAFEKNTKLVTVALSENIVEIGSYAFNGCTGLVNVYSPNVLTHIYNYAFQGCTSIESIELPNSVQLIGYRAFRDCTKLSSINIPLSWDSASANYYQGYIFGGCTSLTKIVVPEGMTELPAYAFQGCTYLKEVTLPSTLTSIGQSAFDGCTSITEIELPAGLTHIYNYAFQGCTGIESMELPNSVQLIGYRAFRNCTKLSSINIPLSWNSATANYNEGHIFSGCTSLTKIVVPEGMTELPAYAFQGCTYLKEVTLPSTLTSIGQSAFDGCTGITEITLPAELTHIYNYAFQGCTGIESMELPNSVQLIGYRAFRNCTKLSSINIPLSWNSATSNSNEGDIFNGCSSLTSIVVPEGITQLPAYAFCGSDYLKTISLPSTLTSIGNYAFEGCSHLRLSDVPIKVNSIGKYAYANCDSLRYVIVSNPTCTIGANAFKNSSKMVLVCDMNSLATVHAIDNDLQYSAMESKESQSLGLLDRTGTYYVANTSSLDTNGYVTFTIDYAVDDEKWVEVSHRKVVIKIPTGTELIESSLRIGDAICTDYDYDGEELRITIPVSDNKCTLKFSAKAVEDRDIRSYVLLQYYQDGSTKQELIGIIDESVDMFTLYAEKLTSSRSVKVEGAAPAQASVNIYVNGKIQKTVTASKAGSYQANITLEGDAVEQMFQIAADCTTATGETLSASHSIKYKQEAPELTGFVFYIDGDENQAVDLYDLSQNGIRPSITHTGSQHPYKFVITFENPEAIDTLYVTSTRSNIKKSIPAVYDEASGTFIAEGHFDETNKLYVPGSLGLEYNLTRKDIKVGDEVNWDEFRSYLSPELINGAVVNSTPTEVGSYGTIDLSGVSESLADVVLDYSVDLFDEATDGNLGDLMSMVGVVEKIYGYVVPGADDSRYYMLLDFRDPETVSMVVTDLTGVANKAVQFKLSATEFGDQIWGKSFSDFYDFAGGLSNFTTGVGIINEAFGIYGDYNELCDEIMQSSTITDKAGALKKAEELQIDQLGFMLVTTLLPLVLTGPMTGPTMLMTAMISSMVALSDVFWQLRVTQIKGENYKIKWHIDPSGYVYDNVTNERLQGVTVTAYCIEYDDTDTFWDRVPSESEYGTVWNALEYNQVNPLVTDAEGRYAWDVPEGWWRVKYEKEGYETVWSEWLPVPPPQTEVNIGMTPIATGVIPGDVNDDGIVDTIDRMVLNRYLANWDGYTADTINMKAADVNKDGVVDTLDRMALNRHLANWGGYETLPYLG